jgi:phosphatidylglycerophosphate synthase
VRKYRRDYGEGHVIDDGSVDSIDDRITDGETSDCFHTPKEDADPNTSKSSWPIVLYIPNLMGYLRIFLSVYGLISAIQQQAPTALNTWIAASLLDLFDGIAARRLNQCSKFGVLLDILADNILRTIIWISAIVESLKHNDERVTTIVCCWTAVICLEWITMVCSQCNQANSESGHWKDFQKGRKAPFWIEAVFQNNFRSIPGTIAIFGLFVAPFGSYVWAADRSTKTTWPWKVLLDSEYAALLLIRSAYVGRLLCVVVECWLCLEYISGLIHHDTLQSTKKTR